MIILEVLMYLTLVAVGVIGWFYCGETTKSYVGIDPKPLIIQTIKDKLSSIKNIRHSLKRKKV